eukprot:m.18180 g.18180  ORF g.18180 m.18180 type:complete len:295 (-) comp6226_c0_seq1:139-1023(-)
MDIISIVVPFSAVPLNLIYIILCTITLQLILKRLLGPSSDNHFVVPNIDIAAKLPKTDAKSNMEVKSTSVDVSKTGNGNKFALVLENVFSDEECDTLVEVSKSVGYKPATINIGGKLVTVPDYRKHSSCVIDSVEFANLLWNRINPHMPDIYPTTTTEQGYQPVGLYERLRFLNYKPGDFFSPHKDGTYNHPARPLEEASKVTVMLYLNDLQNNGGGTTFVHPDSQFIQQDEENEGEEKNKCNEIIYEDGRGNLTITPRKGMVLMFDHKIMHEGSLLRAGEKWCMRADVMYRTK